MLTFKETMDQHSREVWRDEKMIGRIMWHKGRPASYVPRKWENITLDELKQIVAALSEYSGEDLKNESRIDLRYGS